MPWDESRLEVATVDPSDGGLPSCVQRVASIHDAGTAVFQPTFSPNGRYLAYVSDVDGWGGLYLHDLESHQRRPLLVDEAELSAPAWRQGERSMAWSPDSRRIYVCRNQDARVTLWSVDVPEGRTRPVAALSEYEDVSQPAVSPSGKLAVIASASTIPPRLMVWDPQSDTVRVRARARSELIAPERLVRPQSLSWEASDGEKVFGLLYLPTDLLATSDEAPPLLVRVHGGPTGQARASFSAEDQFFATRGFAVLQVNYRGSAGYGKPYRERLRGNWGILDVDDVVTGAKFVAAKGLADASRMAIMGGSAGGYTVLQVLVHHPGVFRAALCLYGIGNLFTLATDTHKFERHYLDSLLGPLPEAAARYRERSPLFHVDRIRDPVAIFQGEEDSVVPPSQAEAIVGALERSRVPHEYHLYAGEGHGWRKAATIERFHEAALLFLRRYVVLS
jgi:dipeptidyl aminopeptidase/acylaminoacyl peptidase